MKANTTIRSFAVLLWMIITVAANAATFTAIKSGQWSDASTWGGQAPGSQIITDNIIIPAGIVVTMDISVNISGTLASLEVDGQLVSTSTSLNLKKGALYGTGVIKLPRLSTGKNAEILYEGVIEATELENRGNAGLSSSFTGSTMALNDVMEVNSPDTTPGGGDTTGGPGGPPPPGTMSVQEHGHLVNTYPNPVADVLVFEMAEIQTATINITDASGKVILMQDIENHSFNTRHTLDLSLLPSGIYFMKVEAGDGKLITRKIIKS